MLGGPSPLGRIRLDPCGGCITHRLGLIPPNLVDAPPPTVCSFYHTSLPMYSPDASSMKYILNKKKFFLWGGSLVPNKHKKAATISPAAGFGPLAVPPPPNTKEGRVRLVFLSNPPSFSVMVTSVPSGSPLLAGLVRRLPPPPGCPLGQPLLPLQLRTGRHRLGGPCPCCFCCSCCCCGCLGCVLDEETRQLQD